MSIALLIFAHGGNEAWKKQVRESLKSLERLFPTRIVFSDELDEIGDIVSLMEEKAEKIFVFPLFISRSKFIQKIKRILGDRESIIFYSEDFPLCNEEVAKVLAQRAFEKCEECANILIVAHGSIDDEDNELLIQKIEDISIFLKKLGFKKIDISTIRDDSPDEIRKKATEDFYKKAKSADLILPFFLAKGETLKKLEKILGEEHKYKLARPLLPSKRIVRLIENEVRRVGEEIRKV